MIVANLDGPTQVYLSNGTTTPFAGVSAYTLTGGDDAPSLAVVTDPVSGRQDLLVGTAGNGVLFYKNDGAAEPFQADTPVTIGSNSAYVTSMVMGDVNGDNLSDLIVGANDGSVKLWVNSGTGTPFSGAGNVIAAGVANSGPALVALGHFHDSTGLPDLAVVNSSGSTSGSLEIYENNSTGESAPFVGEQPIVTGYGGITAMVDINPSNTGKYDSLAVALTDSQGDSSAFVLANTFTNSPSDMFTPLQIVGTDGASSLAVADFNDDGNPNLVVGRKGAASEVFLGNGTGNPYKYAEMSPSMTQKYFLFSEEHR